MLGHIRLLAAFFRFRISALKRGMVFGRQIHKHNGVINERIDAALRRRRLYAQIAKQNRLRGNTTLAIANSRIAKESLNLVKTLESKKLEKAK
jgi:hypothetical protein